MAYTLDFLKYEFMQFARNPFLWIAQLFCFFTIKSEASHFLGKKHYLFSALIQSGSISVSQEMIARAVIFPLSALLLLMIFAFAGYLRAHLLLEPGIEELKTALPEEGQPGHEDK